MLLPRHGDYLLPRERLVAAFFRVRVVANIPSRQTECRDVYASLSGPPPLRSTRQDAFGNLGPT